MEWENNLKRSQSLKAMTRERPIWTGAGLRGRTTSVSQLVARYQVGEGHHTQITTRITVEEKPKEDPYMVWRPHLKESGQRDDADSSTQSVSRRNEECMESKNLTSLTRSRSIDSLKAKFESKERHHSKEAKVVSAPRKADNTQMSKGVAGGQTRSIEKADNSTKIQRRKTIGGIDFEQLAASQAEEKRKSIADFRDSSEKVCVSVKAISALYLSKVAPLQPKTLVPTSAVGKRTKITKMAEGTTDDILPPALEEDQSGGHGRSTIGTIQQRRRKSELKRLLKHTHPEITMLDKVVEKELAEVLSSEAKVTACEMGYEGEVFSKCLIFENCNTSKIVSPHTTNMEEETDIKGPTPTVFEEPGNHRDLQFIDEEVKIDVQATRTIFEEQSMKATPLKQPQSKEMFSNIDNATPNQVKEEGKHGISDCGSAGHNQGPCEGILDEDFTNVPETFRDACKTSVDLLHHNPFIAANVEKEHTSFQSTKNNIPEIDRANVKNRTHLFESMPFDKIRQQNKDDIETMVENIKETLHFLYTANVIRSKGSIIEVYETMIARKAKFLLTDSGPEIVYDEVAEGGAQNLILQLLPRANVKAHIKYLKEDSEGSVRSTEIHAPAHQHHSDTEFKTASVVQLIEDILIQDNSLRKGVLIEDEADSGHAEVSVYSLYHYFDGDDIKSYCPPRQTTAEVTEPEINEGIQTIIPELSRVITQSAINCLQETAQNQMCAAPVRPDITTKGNVKLFKSCIEKGELEYLKTLQAESEMLEEVPLNSPGHNTTHHEEIAEDTEYAHVDIKRLKGIFSGDHRQRQTKQEMSKSVPRSPAKWDEKSKVNTDHKARGTQRSSQSNACRFIDPSLSYQDNECIHQAELVAVVNKCDEISHLQTAISNLHRATVEAKSIHDSLQERQDKHQSTQTLFENPDASIIPLKTNEDFSKVSKDHSEACTVQSHDAVAKIEDEEVVLEGKLKAALQSLEKSNINVTQGDFKAAMIYRNANKSNTSLSSEIIVQKPGSEPKSTQGPVEHDVAIRAKECASQNVSILEKNTKLLGPRPAIPPKPEHLKVKQKEPTKPSVASAETQIKKTKEMFFHPTPKTATKPCGNDENVTNVTKHECLQKAGSECVKIPATSQATSVDKMNFYKQEENDVTAEPKMTENETDESHVNFHEACQKFGGKKTPLKKTPPAKPKRVKITAAEAKDHEKDNSTLPTECTKPKSGGQINECEGKVTMRERKVQNETEDERRQRLSVHMDEIMRGNITAAMEIYDNLRKQEELENILIRVEEIEQDTSEVDVKSLRKVFEDVPEWVVSSDKRIHNKERVQQKEEKPKLVKRNSESKCPMAHVFGDLERASEEIIHLKEQTLARLLDIEEAIKKALCSVSNLKSESDIAGLSSLFKESLGAVQTPASSGNIRTLSIGSSRTITQKSASRANESQRASSESVSAKQPTPSPAFISIQSAARKTDLPKEVTLCPSCRHSPKPEEKFKATKTLKCNSPVPIRKVDSRRGARKESSHSTLNPRRRELSVLEVQTDPKGTQASIVGTKTVTENYERTDTFGNRFYSTKKSTVLTTEPQTMTCPVQTCPATHQFQSVSQEVCSACFKPVYPMEKVTTDKYIFHKTCFCCKHCKKKLSMLSYASLYGALYCTFHYKQLFRTKENYGESFGFSQNKSRWTPSSAAESNA